MDDRPSGYHRYEFGGFRLDASRRLIETIADGRRLVIAPKVFDAALYFVEHPGQLLLKEQMLADLWPGYIVEENSLTQAISNLRRTLGEKRREHRYIVTVPRHGYRFVATVHQVSAASDWPRISDRTVAVLPLDNWGSSVDDGLLSAGIAESVLHRLAAVRGLKLVSQTSSFAFHGARIDVREIGRQLGARYLVEGSLQHAGARRRITVQLIDAVDGTHVWSKLFDCMTEDVFAIEDEISRAVVDELRRSLPWSAGSSLPALVDGPRRAASTAASARLPGVQGREAAKY